MNKSKRSYYLAAADTYAAAVAGGVAAAVGSVELRRDPPLRGSGVPRSPHSKDATSGYCDILFPLHIIVTIELNDSTSIYFF